ncbi:ATP-dependent RNA helicase HrpA [Salmonella enterica subsp. enterica]|uniref:ATP-dependent RNA helicase HrpA n=1 Tax=Salmonella enterica I TaxID=59201 RepID=A0A3S4LVS3_SALET|nr:ATP-dependent RNA helicase HrpA [Salmonella enterica subsp. enterica]
MLEELGAITADEQQTAYKADATGPTIIPVAGRPRALARMVLEAQKTWLCARSDDHYFRTLYSGSARAAQWIRQQASDEKHRRFHDKGIRFSGVC